MNPPDQNLCFRMKSNRAPSNAQLQELQAALSNDIKAGIADIWGPFVNNYISMEIDGIVRDVARRTT